MKKLYLLLMMCWLLQSFHKLQAQQCAISLTAASGDTVQTICAGAPIVAITFLTTADGFTTTGLPQGVFANLTEGLFSIYGTPLTAGTSNYTISLDGQCIVSGSIKVNALPTAAVSLSGSSNICNGSSTAIQIKFTGTAPWSGVLQNYDAFTATGTSLALTVSPAVNTTYSLVTLQDATGCAATASGLTGNVAITVNPIPPPPVVSSPVEYCQNVVATQLTATGTNLLWYTASGTAPGSAIAPTPSTVVAGNTTYYVSQTKNGCESLRDSIKVIINPTLVINDIRDTAFCNGSFVSNGIPFSGTPANAIFTWTNSNTNIGLAANGTGNIPPFNANNPNATSDLSVITVKGTSQQGCANAFNKTFKIKIQPGPLYIGERQKLVCSNEGFQQVLQSSAEGTSFRWQRTLPPGVTGLPLNGDTATNTINDKLYNSNNTPVTVKYMLTLFNGSGESCTTLDEFDVIVNPVPSIDSIPDTVFCAEHFVDTGIKFESNGSPDVIYTWQNDNTNIGLTSGGTGNLPPFVARNFTTDTIKANITVSVTTKENLCAGAGTKTFTITVLPVAVFTSTTDTSICNNTPFSYTATSSVISATSFSWRRLLLPNGVTGLLKDTTSSGTIADLLSNNTDTAVVVKYLFYLTTGNGCVTNQLLNVTVNPTPSVNAFGSYTFCNGTPVNDIPAFTSPVATALFTWTASPSVGFGTSGKDSIPDFVATNTGTQPIVSMDTVIAFVIASGQQCAVADTAVFTITVNPSPPKPFFTWLDLNGGSLCNASKNINFNISSPAAGIAYLWTASDVNIAIRDTNDANTVISFTNLINKAGITATATDRGTGCIDTTTQQLSVSTASSIEERRIFLKQPGNLLIYPDNTLDKLNGYQWGYDSVLVRNASFGPPIAVQGQVYQFFVPDSRFIVNDVLDTTTRSFWVLLRKGGCYTKVYYNGPYAWRPAPVTGTIDNTVQLSVAPNPNGGVFDVVLTGNIYGSIDLKIYNSMGQVVLGKNFMKTTPYLNERISAHKLPNGLYYLSVNSSDLKKVVTRFVIQH